MRRVRLLAALLAAGCVGGTVAGCAGGAGGGSGGSAENLPAGSTVTGDLTVFAAASLTGSFTDLGRRFEQAHPGARVRLTFGGSSGLARQIVDGAPVDVFAAASPATMQAAEIPESVVFARNSLEIAVPTDNPGKVTGLTDFGREELKLALCAPQVPCGVASEKAFTQAGVTPRPDTLEQDVKAVLAKVQLGEVDAGLVYRTDIRAAAGKVNGIALAQAASTDYPIAALDSAPNPASAAAFVAYVRSAEGRAVLTDAGFG